uniref:HAT C-terminal dimerisation domain-containing protein n=1 Tax=Cajanus cajan TaxID=3821 RepID=A0A151R8N5_CAJCA|nr:hypothetical protein KK1_039726 [Cajanus cajan]
MIQFQHYEHDILNYFKFEDILMLYELCRELSSLRKLIIYHLLRVIHLVLTLPILFVSTKYAFLIIEIVKSRLCNKMKNKFITNNLIIYIKKDIAKILSTK